MSAEAIAPQTTPTGAMIKTLGLVSAICGLIIVGSYQVTLPAVQENKRIALERAVLKVVPKAKSVVEYFTLPGNKIEPAKGDLPADAVRFYVGYDDAGQLAGIAAEGGAKGYADVVRIMFGYQADCQCITGIGVVSMRETPGIGDKILVDAAFLENFKALDAKVNTELTALANEVKTVKHGTKANPWQIDAIAGATITSRAVGKAINDTAQALLPKLVPNIDRLRSKAS